MKVLVDIKVEKSSSPGKIGSHRGNLINIEIKNFTRVDCLVGVLKYYRNNITQDRLEKLVKYFINKMEVNIQKNPRNELKTVLCFYINFKPGDYLITENEELYGINEEFGSEFLLFSPDFESMEILKKLDKKDVEAIVSL